MSVCFVAVCVSNTYTRACSGATFVLRGSIDTEICFCCLLVCWFGQNARACVCVCAFLLVCVCVCVCSCITINDIGTCVRACVCVCMFCVSNLRANREIDPPCCVCKCVSDWFVGGIGF